MDVIRHKLAFPSLIPWPGTCRALPLYPLPEADLADAIQVQRHARWMACTSLLLLPPALARLAPLLPFVQSFEAAFHTGFVLTELLVILLLLDDRRLGQRLPPYRWLLVLTLVQHAGFALIADVPAWQAFSRLLGDLA